MSKVILRSILCITGSVASLPALVLGEQEVARVTVTLPESAVIGMPLPVDLRIRGPVKIVDPRLTSDLNPFALVLKHDEHLLHFAAQAKLRQPTGINAGGILLGPDGIQTSPAQYIRLPAPTVDVAAGVTVHVTVDLSLLVARLGNREFYLAGRPDPKLLPPGDYELDVTAKDVKVEFRVGRVRLRVPNPAEEALLDKLMELAEKEGNRNSSLLGDNPLWSTYVLRRVDVLKNVDLKQLSETAVKQLAFYEALSLLVHDPQPIEKLAFDDAWLNQALPAYREDLVMLRFEIESARGDRKAAARTRAAILSERPHRASVLDYVTKIGGVIRYYRELKQQGK